MKQSDITSRIVDIEMIIQNAIWNGHRCSENDEYQPLRIERDVLRCLYFGNESKHCKKN
jgi:hypothetical protein